MSEPTTADQRVAQLEAAIRKHRDYRGDDRCFQDDAELYAVLPEGDARPARDSAVTIENCQRYIACRQDPNREYVSPQRAIEELEQLIKNDINNLRWRVKRGVLWGNVSYQFGIGSTRAIALCKRLGFDPDETRHP